jgi:hypothetical protein
MCDSSSVEATDSGSYLQIPDAEIDELRRKHAIRRRQGFLLLLLSSSMFCLSVFIFIGTYRLGFGVVAEYPSLRKQLPQNIGKRLPSDISRRYRVRICRSVAIGVASLPCYIGSLLLFRGTRSLKKHAQLVLLDDHRAPVLYLRSFVDDETQDPHFGLKWTWRCFLPAMKFNRVVVEEDLADELSRYVGPVIAIGRPGEPLPELGAHRLYVDDDHWQEEISRHMRAARLIILRIGDSEGLLWELQQLLDTVPPERIVLFSPSRTFPDRIQRLVSDRWGIQLQAGRFVAFDSARTPNCFSEIGNVLMFLGLFVPKRGMACILDTVRRRSAGEVALRAVGVLFVGTVAAMTSWLLVAIIDPPHPRIVFSFLCIGISLALIGISFLLPVDEPPMQTRPGKTA